MSDLKFEFDIADFSKQFKDLSSQVEEDLKKGLRNLAEMTTTKTQELAIEKLGGGSSLTNIYLENLGWYPVDEYTSIVELKAPALFIESGRKSGFMEELLNGKSSKVSKDGKRYAVIPFKHSESSSGEDSEGKRLEDFQSNKAKLLVNELKIALQKEGVDIKKIEYGKDGSPRLGKLHTFDLESARGKNPTTGKDHKSGFLKGVSIYQREVFNKNTNKKEIRRDVMTFRVITEDHKNEGLWVHPGRQPENFMDKAFEWAVKEFEDKILPEILKKYGE